MNHPAIKIKVGQIWENKRTKQQLLVCGKKRDKYLTKILTDKPDVYAGTHTMSRTVLWKKFSLIS